ncbi:MAG: ribosome small subunit-dependent GTPase A [Bacteroidota bacterium]|nr:ribosome small subunit-dependent GTPase A [Bacteroidota bacterium]
MVTKSTGKQYHVLSGHSLVTCVLRGKIRLQGIKATNPVAVGDKVEFQMIDDIMGQIIKVLPRKNHLLRQSTNLSKRTHVLAANIDQAILMATLNTPLTTRVFIDRFLVSAESFRIPVILIFNKTDLYNQEEIDELFELEHTYAKVVKEFHAISAIHASAQELANSILKDKTSVIAGHSGSGKTSFINLADPDLKLKTGEISTYHQSGKHTTSYAEMHHIKSGGYIIDTPGIRAFGINHIEKKELYHYFPEIFERAKECKFYNCLHINEPGCAVVEAVENGDMAPSRYFSYLNLYEDKGTKHREVDY